MTYSGFVNMASGGRGGGANGVMSSSAWDGAGSSSTDDVCDLSTQQALSTLRENPNKKCMSLHSAEDTSPPGRPVHSDTTLTHLGTVLAMQKLLCKHDSLTFPVLSIAKQSLTQLSELRHRGDNENVQTLKR